MVFRFGELFCGPGGMAKGALEARFRHGEDLFAIEHEWASDWDPDACETYRRNICPQNGHSVVCEDVRRLDMSALTPIDGFAFGFPCNDFSVVGERKGVQGQYGPLYTYGAQVIRQFEPKWFVAENVSGLLSSNDGRAFERIVSDLVDLGYRLTIHLYKFEEYGVPQARHRLVIVGYHDSLGLRFLVPRPAGRFVSCQAAIEEPPIPMDAPNHEYTRQSPIVVQRLKYIKPGQNAWNADLPEHLRLNVPRTRLSHIYRRLDPEKPAYTITGSGGGGTHSYHWSEHRALTNRERARLQTFPDDYIFCGNKESVRKQIGMAVPVTGARIIFESILKMFAGIEYEFDEPNIGYFDQETLRSHQMALELRERSRFLYRTERKS